MIKIEYKDKRHSENVEITEINVVNAKEEEQRVIKHLIRLGKGLPVAVEKDYFQHKVETGLVGKIKLLSRYGDLIGKIKIYREL